MQLAKKNNFGTTQEEDGVLFSQHLYNTKSSGGT